jgi:RNA polymerase sigma-70 factor (ECF subfamily)
MPPHSDYARWFAEEVQPHEPLLRAWLRSRFATLRDIDDLVQETYLRLFRARSAGKIDHPKSYLFATARNAALDRLRRDRIVAFEPLTDSAAPLVSAPSPDLRAADADAELALLTAALRALPERCREVLVLRKHHGLSHEEIATRLGISKNTVNAQITLGMMRCRQYFRDHGFTTGGAP